MTSSVPRESRSNLCFDAGPKQRGVAMLPGPGQATRWAAARKWRVLVNYERSLMTAALLAYCGLLFSLLAAPSIAADAQVRPRHVRVGTLAPPAIGSAEKGLREGLTRLGYIEDGNLAIEPRSRDSVEALRSAALALVPRAAADSPRLGVGSGSKGPF